MVLLLCDPFGPFTMTLTSPTNLVCLWDSARIGRKPSPRHALFDERSDQKYVGRLQKSLDDSDGVDREGMRF